MSRIFNPLPAFLIITIIMLDLYSNTVRMPDLPISRSMLGVSLYTYYVLKVKIKNSLKMGAVVVAGVIVAVVVVQS